MYNKTAIACVLCWENVNFLIYDFLNDNLAFSQINLDFHNQNQRKVRCLHLQ